MRSSIPFKAPVIGSFASHVRYVVVEGGASGTRACITSVDGQELARGSAEGFSLHRGTDQYWRNITLAIGRALDDVPDAEQRPAQLPENRALGLGLEGAEDPDLCRQLLEPIRAQSVLAIGWQAA